MSGLFSLKNLTGKKVRDLKKLQKAYNNIPVESQKTLDALNKSIASRTKTHTAHAAEWKKYLDATPMEKWDRNLLNQYDAKSRTLRAGIDSDNFRKKIVEDKLSDYTRNSVSKNREFDKQIGMAKTDRDVSRLMTGLYGGAIGASVYGHHLENKKKRPKYGTNKNASIYCAAIEKVAVGI